MTNLTDIKVSKTHLLSAIGTTNCYIRSKAEDKLVIEASKDNKVTILTVFFKKNNKVSFLIQGKNVEFGVEYANELVQYAQEQEQWSNTHQLATSIDLSKSREYSLEELRAAILTKKQDAQKAPWEE